MLSNQNSNGTVHRTTTIILKFVLDHRRSQIARTILRKKKAGDIVVPDFKLYYKAVKIKEYSTSTKAGTHIKGTDLSAWKQSIRVQTIYNKGMKNMNRRQGSLFSEWYGESWTAS